MELSDEFDAIRDCNKLIKERRYYIMSLKKGKKLAKVLCAVALCGVMSVGMTVSASAASIDLGAQSGITVLTVKKGTNAGDNTNTKDTKAAESKLQQYIVNGGKSGSKDTNVTEKAYKLEGGGTTTYSNLVDKNAVSTGYVNEVEFNKLKGSEKAEFLGDMNNSANIAVAEDDLVSDDTKTTWLTNLQNCSGIGSQLMTTLLQNTKPDYVTANRIYEPFSGVVGTCLALGAILIMAALGLVMVVDLSYIGIPFFRGMVDGDGSSGQGGKPKFISHEAYSAVQTAEGGQGGSGQDSGSKKTAVGLYFKKRVVMLVILGVCLLYLIQGQIYTLVAWILDLLSGFLGF